MMLRFMKKTIRSVFRKHAFDVMRIEPPKTLKAECVNGWFSPDECRQLYMHVAMTSGPILEIGHFLGRSTACICEAIHDTRKPREFRSYDLGFRSAVDFKAYYNTIHNADVAVPVLLEEVFSKSQTTTEIALQNLKALQLDNYVTLISGNAFEVDHNKYDLIFCDALHDANEINANIPHIVTHSNHGCVWAFHDMDQRSIDLVLRLANTEFRELTQSLGMFIYMG